ncbi:SMP-30/gluconolactonase/LRE family protein [Pararhodonellum marinum]|uniref:SMP-30/gluconolactonase/LRE family protein n=1 Tax=Pararhodonellum marinum TaxID=2755358 RepID=UPI00188FDE63|nr:SMP-30/gluconolactonase/LRE family protein [Pararhodonellum marinum]
MNFPKPIPSCSILLLLILVFTQQNAISQIEGGKSIIAKNAEVTKIKDGFKFTEGPAVNRIGDVFFTDQPNDKIHKWSSLTGEVTTFVEEAGRANGMYFELGGNLIACVDMENQLWSFDEKGNKTVLIENFKGNRLNGPNDLWISPLGGIYISDPLYKRAYWDRDPNMQVSGEHLYFLSPDKIQFFPVDENLVKPNGLVGTPDGKKLYVADIGDKKTYVYDIEEDGYLSNRRLFVEMGSDGMTIDHKGNVYLTGDGVTVFNSKGDKIAHIPTGASWTSNVCFGGGDRKTLFITASDAVYKLDMKVRGVW